MSSPSGDPSRGRMVRRPSRRRRVPGLAAAGLLTVFVGTFATLWYSEVPPEVIEVGDAGSVLTAELLNPSELTVPAADVDRPVYQHSVVPGGVRSADEVARVMARDPVVAAHYADIDVSKLRKARLVVPARAHVSYRMGDEVYFTSKPVSIPVGEPVLTDGQKTIRERCGNVISVEPIGPAAATEPPVEQLDRVIAPVGPAAQRSASAADPAAHGGAGAPSLDIPSSAIPFAGGPPPGVQPVGPSAGGVPPGTTPPTPPFIPRGTTPSPGTPTPFSGDPTPPPGPAPTPTPPVPPPAPDPTPPTPTPPPANPPPSPTPPPPVPPPANPPPTPTPPAPPPDLPPPPFPTPPPANPPPPPYFPPAPPPDPPLPVPEPSTFVLVGIGGAVGLAKLIRARRAGK